MSHGRMDCEIKEQANFIFEIVMDASSSLLLAKSGVTVSSSIYPGPDW
jgi:hypothetical protein